MKWRVAAENLEAEKLLPPLKPDGSHLGINYADAYIRSISTTLADGRQVSCKRRGLQIILAVGDKKGEGLMRRLDHGPAAKNILRKALEEAAGKIGATFLVEDYTIYMDLKE